MQNKAQNDDVFLGCGSPEWMQFWHDVEAQAKVVRAMMMRDAWLELGGDDRPWQDWFKTVEREYSFADLAEMRKRIAANLQGPKPDFPALE